jgi:hypothetical protein
MRVYNCKIARDKWKKSGVLIYYRVSDRKGKGKIYNRVDGPSYYNVDNLDFYCKLWIFGDRVIVEVNIWEFLHD